MAHIHLHDNVLIVGARLIVSDPASLSDLKLAVADQSLNGVFHLGVQSCVPHVEEFHLHIGESKILILCQNHDDLIKNLFDTGVGNFVIDAKVVLLVSLNPTDIIMSVGYKMYREVLILVLPIILNIIIAHIEGCTIGLGEIDLLRAANFPLSFTSLIVEVLLERLSCSIFVSVRFYFFEVH